MCGTASREKFCEQQVSDTLPRYRIGKSHAACRFWSSVRARRASKQPRMKKYHQQNSLPSRSNVADDPSRLQFEQLPAKRRVKHEEIILQANSVVDNLCRTLQEGDFLSSPWPRWGRSFSSHCFWHKQVLKGSVSGKSPSLENRGKRCRVCDKGVTAAPMFLVRQNRSKLA